MNLFLLNPLFLVVQIIQYHDNKLFVIEWSYSDKNCMLTKRL